MNFLKGVARGFVLGVLRIYSRITFRIKVIGRENIPKEGAVLFCGNHRYYHDPVFIEAFTPRYTRFIAKEELSHIAALKPLAKLFEVIFVKRDSKDLGPLKESLKTLKEGGAIGIFPEGTRNGLEKNEGQIKNGAAYLALKTGAQIIPIGIRGGEKPFKKAYMIYGKPLDLSKYEGIKKVDDTVEQEVSDMLKKEIIRLTTDDIKMLKEANK